MQCDRQNFVILDYFLPFYAPPNNQENQNSKKKKKKKLKKKKKKKSEKNTWRYYHFTYVYHT